MIDSDAFEAQATVGRLSRNRRTRAALGLGLLLAAAGAQAGQDAAPTRPPIVRQVLEPVPPDRLPTPVPPAPPGSSVPKYAIAFSDDGDFYVCGYGSAVHYASEYLAFEAEHRPRSADEREGYSPARESDIPQPELPPAHLRPGYVMLRVAVAPDGKVRDALVACSSDVYFNDAALAAVRSATFVPASSRGVPVASVESVEYWYPRF